MGKEKDNVIKRKSRDFAIDIINLYKWLCEIQHEYIMSKQLLRSGTRLFIALHRNIPNFVFRIHN